MTYQENSHTGQEKAVSHSPARGSRFGVEVLYFLDIENGVGDKVANISYHLKNGSVKSRDRLSVYVKTGFGRGARVSGKNVMSDNLVGHAGEVSDKAYDLYNKSGMVDPLDIADSIEVLMNSYQMF